MYDYTCIVQVLRLLIVILCHEPAYPFLIVNVHVR